MGRRIRKRMVLFLLALFLLSAGYEKKCSGNLGFKYGSVTCRFILQG